MMVKTGGVMILKSHTDAARSRFQELVQLQKNVERCVMAD